MNLRRQRPIIAQRLAQLLVVAILLGGLPIAASSLLPDRSTPAFTLDLCHPQPVFSVGAASSVLASFTLCSFSIVIEDHGLNELSHLLAIDRLGEAPDPPPPEMSTRLQSSRLL